jgi:hypothetical protein
MLTSHELFGFMSPALANEILNFAYDTDKPTYKATVNGVATALRVRPVYLERQPRPQRHASMIQILSRPGLDAAAGGLLRAWLVKQHRPMLGEFMDALGIKNEQGVVDDLPASIKDAKLKSAIDALLAKYPAETVAVYLNAFTEMNEANWENLKAMLQNDSRLQLGAH